MTADSVISDIGSRESICWSVAGVKRACTFKTFSLLLVF